MDYSMDKKIDKIQKEIKNLPERLQSTILWTIEHYDFVMELCESCEMTEDQVMQHKEEAIADEDYTLVVLLSIVQVLRENNANSNRE